MADCHDHIVTVHGVYEADGLPYLVMQYVAGESLQDGSTGPGRWRSPRSCGSACRRPWGWRRRTRRG